MDEFNLMPKMADSYEVPVHQLGIGPAKQNYYIAFHQDGKMIGTLDFNGPKMIFEGNAEESAKLFIHWLSESFSGRLKEEYERGYKAAKEEVI